jgi:hypothetical protein
MYNKLSFLSTDSLYPVCLALDDFEDSELMGQQVPMINDVISTHDYVGYMVLLEKMCNGELSNEDEKELIELGKELLPVDGLVHDTALNTLISSFAEIIPAVQSQVGLKQIRLRVVPDEYIPKYYFDYEYLGYYDSYNAEIVLCPERISKRADKLLRQNRHITTRELYVVVLVHALAHALMDPTKVEGKSNQYQPLITTIDGFTEREVLMEDSLANMITLQYFDKLGKPEVVRYGEVREVIELQSLPYKFGLDQYDILKPDWRPWREAKKTTKFIKEK